MGRRKRRKRRNRPGPEVRRTTPPPKSEAELNGAGKGEVLTIFAEETPKAFAADSKLTGMVCREPRTAQRHCQGRLRCRPAIVGAKRNRRAWIQQGRRRPGGDCESGYRNRAISRRRTGKRPERQPAGRRSPSENGGRDHRRRYGQDRIVLSAGSRPGGESRPQRQPRQPRQPREPR